MSSGIIKPGNQSKAGPAGLTAVTPNSQAILYDKLKRRATPDSEALASSDDEGDHRQDPLPPPVPQQKPVRRASWLNDTSQTANRPRQGSFASGTMSPTATHPNTPSADPGSSAWGPHPTTSTVLGRGHPGAPSFPWGTAIWNTDRKDPPSRLAEVLPSPTSTHPPGSAGSFFGGATDMPPQTSPGPRDGGPNLPIPFAIPLHPTPKTYRSQSYSVGQLEPDAAGNVGGSSAILGGRARPLPHSGLQHRPSRPSMLSEMASEGMLGKVKEVDDDDEESGESLQGSQNQSAEVRRLTRENALLRQQTQQYSSRAPRPRASTGFGIGNGGYSMQETVPEESDFAVDELEEANDGNDLANKRAVARRMSELGLGPGITRDAGPFRPQYAVDRKLENVKKALWQSSLGFGGIGELPQSRRHSFADIPQRQASISSLNDSVLEGLTQEPQQMQDFSPSYVEGAVFSPTNPGPYYAGGMGMGVAQQHAMGSAAAFGGPFPYPLHAPFSHRPASPHRAIYGVTQPNRSTPLHVVLFKCARADVFYIQEGTGLTVKPGDLVIVEADRGTDLGTVAADNVDWAEAKRLKEHYAEEQYKWLMMYSQNAAQDGVGAGLMAASNGLQGSTVGGMGPPGQHHIQEPNPGELKPKLIKRLAQPHEVHSLRDKEGNEAKAKRVCMQKVKEHGLSMEILDAEFQMDWKKLTFYYFADAYINFNPLVTDLFKIYKTRIWMSAINPASFATQPLGLQAPSGIGPGAVGVGRGGTSSDRRQQAPQPEKQQQQQQQQQASHAFQGPAAAFNPPFGVGADRQVGPPHGPYQVPNYQFPQYAAFASAGRGPGAPYGAAMIPPVDSFPGAFPQAVDYAATMRARLPTPQASGGINQHDQGISALGNQHDWTGAFQGLSLNSR